MKGRIISYKKKKAQNSLYMVNLKKLGNIVVGELFASCLVVGTDCVLRESHCIRRQNYGVLVPELELHHVKRTLQKNEVDNLECFLCLLMKM
jgi:hypothetical protein